MQHTNFEMSESIGKLSKALGSAQSLVGGAIPFNKTNPFYKSKYADLGAHIEKIAPALRASGLVVTQMPFSDGNFVGVTTLVMHESGEWLSSGVAVNVGETQKAAQDAGIVITYLRRYSLAALMFAYGDEDTDANPAQQTSQKASKNPAKKQAAPKDGECLCGVTDAAPGRHHRNDCPAYQ